MNSYKHLTRILDSWNPDDRHFGNGWVWLEISFDFTRINVVATLDHKILDAVRNKEITLFIHITHITGVQPTIAQSFCCFFELLIITDHDIRALNNDFPLFPHGEFVVLRIFAVQYNHIVDMLDAFTGLIYFFQKILTGDDRPGIRMSPAAPGVSIFFSVCELETWNLEPFLPTNWEKNHIFEL